MAVTRAQSAAVKRVTRSQNHSKQSPLFELGKVQTPVLRRKQQSKKSVAGRAAKMASNTAPNFLELPAEIRNIVYEMVVVNPSPTFITYRSIPVQPPLTMVCRQICEECVSIFYTKNTFQFEVFNYDHHYVEAWRAQTVVHRPKNLYVQHKFDRNAGPIEDNLMTWLRNWYCGTWMGTDVEYADDVHHTSYPCDKLFKVASQLRDAKVTWNLARKVLKDIHQAIEAPEPQRTWR